MPVACYPEVPSGVQPSRVRFEALPGTEYFIGVDGQDGQTGVIQLNWSLGVPLSIRRQGLYLVFSWPGSFPDFILEESWAVGGPESVVWSPVDVQPVLVDGVYTASRLIPSGYRAYRLRKP